jgi:hypothetical protein
MDSYQKKELIRIVEFMDAVQKDISKMGGKMERVFEDELRSRNEEIIGLMDNIDGLYSMTENLKNYSEELIQRFEAN